jgi:hypothetical protein
MWNAQTKLGDERRPSDGVSSGVGCVRYKVGGEIENRNGNAPGQGYRPE